MVKVDSAFCMEELATLIKLPGKYDSCLILSSFPLGSGKALQIGGYHFPFLNGYIVPAIPGDMRPRVVVDTADFDLPIELLIGEEVTWF